ncbi:MAG TPA: bifunctional oligoribonuclease/PAP phosphatase NrnA, partial [Bacteroidia bacterium]|nr:bifunctional oligoribonuclease/PAP phosphatase NrnA [Bacteroidia bacterium]
MNTRFPNSETGPLWEFLELPRNIVITTHHRPDGDAMGSSLGLFNFLKLLGHTVVVITPSDYPEFLHWLPGHELVIDFETEKDKSKNLIRDAELIFCLDFNWLSRVEGMEQLLRDSMCKKVLIDHHLNPEPVFDYTFSYPEACSTCELIFQFIDAAGGSNRMNKSIAECLYCGIMTDTHSFRYESMKADTHRVIAKLMEAGAVNYRIHEQVYDTSSENRLRLLGYSLKEKLIVLNEYNTAYISLSEAELRMFNFKSGDTEGLVNYALSIGGVRLAAFFSERDGMIKISFRSKADFSVQELASKYF